MAPRLNVLLSAWHLSKRWVVCLLGVWLLFAPLVFWTKSALIYNLSTFVGALLILLSTIRRGLSSGSEVPPGWTYNPSTWHHRIPVIVLAFIGFFVARMMASFQLGHVDTIWEPFFGEGTRRVLTSDVAKAFPISDAGLGAVAYLLEGLSGLVGDTRRWRTMPWMVFLFFILVVPAGVVSIVLIMLQPVVVGAWCTLCLITAVATLISIPPAIDEVFASSQFLWQARREKKNIWKMFWNGDRARPAASPPVAHHSLNGIALPWNLAISAALGVWIVVVQKDYVIGALITTFAVLATAEPVRSLRFLNVLLGIWLCVTGDVVTGLILLPLSWPRGRIKERFGSWDRFIR